MMVEKNDGTTDGSAAVFPVEKTALQAKRLQTPVYKISEFGRNTTTGRLENPTPRP
ncbi:hypothetical protein [Neisseria chenwenguii]|uniref:hypothetical protein n=1 Tax=Neisseria chenwenguii TaxID=1853278 RepID=UPI0012FD34D5|nr:hypothetical protein [Neisseria chenwenguii]